jgi:hypothetical protein
MSIKKNDSFLFTNIEPIKYFSQPLARFFLRQP